jgi:NitT/TauT family transport system substrate-binding protein
MMAENGLDLYGNVVMVNSDFAEANPDAVKGFIKALIKGFQDTVSDPEAAVGFVIPRNEVLNKDVELDRLNMAIAQSIKTPAVVENGFGGIDPAKLTQSMEFLKTSMGVDQPAGSGQGVRCSYLAPKEERMLP